MYRGIYEDQQRAKKCRAKKKKKKSDRKKYENITRVHIIEHNGNHENADNKVNYKVVGKV